MIQNIQYFMDNYAFLGGAANTLLRQAVLMKQTGKTVHIAVSEYGLEAVCEEYMHLCRAADIPVSKLDFSVSSQPEGTDILAVLESYENIRDFLKLQKPDIVHSLQLNPTVELACRELAIPHVMNIYQALPEFFRLPYPDIYPHFHICDSLMYAAFWRRYLGTESWCVRTLAGTGIRKKCMPDYNHLRIVCVGLLCERKNQIEVIRGFELAVRKGLRGTLQLWGHINREYGDRCAQYIAEQHLEESVAIMGFSEDMESVYQNCDALICGSLSESYPNVISEAMAADVAVISTPVAGVPELVRDWENGYLCTGFCGEDIAEKLLRFSEDVKKGMISRILDNGYRTWEENHSPKAVARSLEAAYRDIVSGYGLTSRTVYTIQDVKSEMAWFVECVLKLPEEFAHGYFIKTNLWKIYAVLCSLREMIKTQRKKCFIWGTGKYGHLYGEILHLFAPDMKISGFTDSHRTGRFEGYEIVSPETVLESGENVILIGVKACQEIMETLNTQGLIYGRDYFTFEQMPW